MGSRFAVASARLVVSVVMLLALVSARAMADGDAGPVVVAVDAGTPAALEAGATGAIIVDAGVAAAPEEPDGEVYDPPPGPSPRAGTDDLVRSLLTLALVVLVAGYLFRQTGGGRGAGGLGAGWASWYLLWLVVPIVIAIVTAHPLVLVIAVAALLARPWLPDPIQWLRHARRAAALEAQVRLNPANAVARRELAMIWIDRRRPARALPHLAAAREREPDDLELRLLEGQAQHLARAHAEAAATCLAIAERDPKFRYGAPWMIRAEALAALRRWPEAEAALRRFQQINSSSLESHVRLAQARTEQGARDDARRERQAARALYGELPRFQRRHQRWWYLRAIIGW